MGIRWNRGSSTTIIEGDLNLDYRDPAGPTRLLAAAILASQYPRGLADLDQAEFPDTIPTLVHTYFAADTQEPVGGGPDAIVGDNVGRFVDQKDNAPLDALVPLGRAVLQDELGFEVVKPDGTSDKYRAIFPTIYTGALSIWAVRKYRAHESVVWDAVDDLEDTASAFNWRNYLIEYFDSKPGLRLIDAPGGNVTLAALPPGIADGDWVTVETVVGLSRQAVYVNGELVAELDGLTRTPEWNAIDLFDDTLNFNAHDNSELAELRLFHGELTAQERADLEAYARAKFAAFSIGPDFDPLTDLNLESLWALDGMALTLTDGQTLPSIDDLKGNHNLFAPSGTQEPTFALEPPLSWVADGGDDTFQALTKDAFNFLHAEGGSIFVVFRLEDINSSTYHTLTATSLFSSSEVGVSFFIDDRAFAGGSNRLRLILGTGSGTSYGINSSAYDLDPAGLTAGWHSACVTFDDVEARLYFDGAQLGPAVAIDDPLPSGDSQHALKTGRTATLAPFEGAKRAIAVSRDILSASEIEALHNYYLGGFA